MFSSNLYVPFAGHQTRVALPINMTNSSPGFKIRLFTKIIRVFKNRKFVSIVFLLITPGQKTLTVRYKSQNTTYVTLGNTLILNVTYVNNGGGGVVLEWRHNQRLIAEISRNNISLSYDSRTITEMNSNLVVKSTELYDSGTYTFTAIPVIGLELSLEFTVIIQGKCVYIQYF